MSDNPTPSFRLVKPSLFGTAQLTLQATDNCIGVVVQDENGSGSIGLTPEETQQARAYMAQHSDPGIAAGVAARITALRVRAQQTAKASTHPQDVLLLIADYAEAAAIDLRLREARAEADAWVRAAELLRADADAQPERPAI